MSNEDEKEAGRRAAQDCFNRYGQEAVLLRANYLASIRGGMRGPVYALGFWQRALEFAGFDPKDALGFWQRAYEFAGFAPKDTDA